MSLHGADKMSRTMEAVLEQAAEEVAEIFRQMVSQISREHGHLDWYALSELYDRFTAKVREQVNCSNSDRLAATTLTVDPAVTVSDFISDTHCSDPNMSTQNCELRGESSPTDLDALFPSFQQAEINHDWNSPGDGDGGTPWQSRIQSPTHDYTIPRSGELPSDDYYGQMQAPSNTREGRYPIGGDSSSGKNQKSYSSSRRSATATKLRTRHETAQKVIPSEAAAKQKKNLMRRKKFQQPLTEHGTIENDIEAREIGVPLSLELSSCVERMGDAKSLIELKRLIRQGRQPRWNQVRLADQSDISQRYSRIKRREDGILYLMLEQWIDILLLYEDCAQKYPERKSQFAIEMSRPSTRSMVKKRGNPLHAAESAITDDILHRLHPDLKPGCPLWKRERESVQKVRQFGSRLARMKEKFGEGVLCLILIACTISGSISASGIHRVSYMKEQAFTEFVDLLAQQSSFVIETSKTLSIIVDCVKEGYLDRIGFVLENVGDEELVKDDECAATHLNRACTVKPRLERYLCKT